MSDPELPWKLLPKEDGVWLHFPSEFHRETLFNLGPKEQVMEAFSQFLWGDMEDQAKQDRARYQGFVSSLNRQMKP